MSIKRIGIVTFIFVLLMAMVAVTSAQDADGKRKPPPRDSPAGKAIMKSLIEDTGLDPEAVREALSDNETTLADLIIANGGNVDASIADAVVAGTEMVNQKVADGEIPQERADEIIANMPDNVSKLVNNPRPERPDRDRRDNPAGKAIMDSLIEDTGLEPEAVREALSDNETTLADLIIANGGNVDASIADAVAAGTEVVNQGVANGEIPQERADEILANMPDNVSKLVNNPRPERPDRDRRDSPAGKAIMDSLIEDTGLEPEAVREALSDNETTLADLIIANGGNVDASIADAVAAGTEVVNQKVADGEIPQERAYEIIANMPDQVSKLVNNPRPERPDRDRRDNPAGKAIMKSLIDDTGLEPEAVREALSDNETTLADLIIANGGNVDASIADAVAAGTEVVNQGVANGEITQERADEIIANMPDNVSKLVNNPRPERPDRERRGDGGEDTDTSSDA